MYPASLRSRVSLVGGVLGVVGVLGLPQPLLAAEVGVSIGQLFIPIEFLLFAATLAGVALFHHYTLQVALAGLAAVTVTKLALSLPIGHEHLTGVPGLMTHLGHEWVTIANLGCLLLGFEILSSHFRDSRIPAWLPNILPSGFLGALALLVLVFILSSFLDNIAAAIIGGTIAGSVFKQRVHIGYLAGIVAASNAGGSGSVVGDTTTTMMWIDGVSPLDVIHAYVAAGVALVISGTIASWQQTKYQPIQSDAASGIKIDWLRVLTVAVILIAAIFTNVAVNTLYPQYADTAPWIGLAVWVAILVMSPLAHPHWSGLPAAAKGAAFLLSLVLCASMMPVESLPPASAWVTMGLGYVSAVFDNIPLTKLALAQGGYDWGFLAFAVGYGGSMIWFGSSAGVALSTEFPEARSVGRWLRYGWHVALAYTVSFLVMNAVLGFHPHPKHKESPRPGVHAADHATPHASGDVGHTEQEHTSEAAAEPVTAE